MRKIVIQFGGSDTSQVEAFTKAIQHLTDTHSNTIAEWTFILSPYILKKIQPVNYIGYLDSRNPHISKYRTVIRANRVLEATFKENYFNIAVRFLSDRLNFKKSHTLLITKGTQFTPLRRNPASLLLESVFNPCDGYGSSAESMALAMGLIDPHFAWKPVSTNHDAYALAQPGAIDLINACKSIHKFDNYLLYYTPHVTEITRRARRSKIKTSLMTMFETTQVPVLWPDRINANFDQLIVPSRFCKKLFNKCGVVIPIKICPLGVDLTRWTYKERTPPQNRPYRFLIYANVQWECPRKNNNLVLEAFNKAFKDNPDVELIIKTSFGSAQGLPSLPSNVKVIDQRLSQVV